MEGIPNQERIIDKSEVMDEIKTKGIEGPGVRELIEQWTIQQEKIAEEFGTSESSINLNIDRADLYLATGDKEGALEALEDARLHAHQEGNLELYNKIMIRMDEIES